MDASEPTPMKNRTTVERKSERELVVTRTGIHPGSSPGQAFARKRSGAVSKRKEKVDGRKKRG